MFLNSHKKTKNTKNSFKTFLVVGSKMFLTFELQFLFWNKGNLSFELSSLWSKTRRKLLFPFELRSNRVETHRFQNKDTKKYDRCSVQGKKVELYLSSVRLGSFLMNSTKVFQSSNYKLLTHPNAKIRTNIKKPYKQTIVPVEYTLENYHRSNQDTCLVQKPIVSEGDWVETGDLLADCSASVGGELALGQNILVAYMPWEGFNYEDAILISERLVYEDIYTSVHIEKYETEIRNTKYGKEKITRDLPNVFDKDIQHLDSYGICKIGAEIEAGAILVGKITPINKKSKTPYEKLLYTLLEKKFAPYKENSLRAPKGIKAKVMNIFLINEAFNAEKKNKHSNKNKLANFFIFSKNKKPKKKKNLFVSKTIQSFVGVFTPKAANQWDETRVVSEVGPFIIEKKKRNEEPFNYYANYDLDTRKDNSSELNFRIKKGLCHWFFQKNKIQQKFNITKMMPDTISHIHVYLAEKRKIQIGDKVSGRHGNKGIISQIIPRQDMPYLPDGTPLDMILNPLGVPSRMNVGQIFECLLGLAGKYLMTNYRILPFDEIYGPEASRTFVFSKLYQAKKKTGMNWLFDANFPGKTRLFDGRTGQCFDQPVTVGFSYILKLVHLVDDKLHSRSTGPYSLVTQQPLRGRAKQGGQRLGEMEVWALEGYGAAFILLEMLTIKSDNISGRLTLWSNILLNRQISFGTPESFKVLVSELQSLCLNIGLYS